jgi:hypothetical protein
LEYEGSVRCLEGEGEGTDDGESFVQRVQGEVEKN